MPQCSVFHAMTRVNEKELWTRSPLEKRYENASNFRRGLAKEAKAVSESIQILNDL